MAAEEEEIRGVLEFTSVKGRDWGLEKADGTIPSAFSNPLSNP